MGDNNYEIETVLVHDSNRFDKGAVNTPIYQTTSFAYRTAEEIAAVFNKRKDGFIYSRISNPTNNTFEKKVTKLEEGLGAVSCASGMSAISTAVLSLVEKGDEIVAGSSLFGGTYKFLNEDLAYWGIKTIFVESNEPEAYRQAVTEKTKLIYLESIGNPRLDIPDIKAISAIAHEAGIPLMVDNTFMTPYLFKAKEFGVDIVIHSTSKFINGAANSIGGIIVDLGTFDWEGNKFPLLKDYLKYGPFCYLAKMRQDIYRNLGGCASPFNSFLNNLGIGTLAVRMDKHCYNALQLAEFLQESDTVKKVNYPGLTSHPDHEIAVKQFGNKFGGLLTFQLADRKECFQVINDLELAKNTANLGDIRTLVIHPASTIYTNHSRDEQERLGVNPGLIRVSVGIENTNDIIQDFARALSELN